jgi:hypothetical protein
VLSARLLAPSLEVFKEVVYRSESVMERTSSRTYRLDVHRYFMDWSQEVVEMTEFFPVVVCELFILTYVGILVDLIKRKSVS